MEARGWYDRRTESINSNVVFPYTFTGVADELEYALIPCTHDDCSDISYSIDLLLAFQLLCNLVGLFKVLEVTLHPMHSAAIPILLELFLCFFCMLLLLRKQDDLGCVVLKQVSRDAESDAGRTACNNVYLQLVF